MAVTTYGATRQHLIDKQFQFNRNRNKERRKNECVAELLVGLVENSLGQVVVNTLSRLLPD